MIIIKRLFCIILTIVLCLPMSGCWNYIGLNELSIVMGTAIDNSTNIDGYELTFEIVDLNASSAKEGGHKSKIVTSEGETIFDAVRNARKKIRNKLFFSYMQAIVISEQIAKEEGIKPTIDWFLREAHPRETVHLVVSQEKTAKELITEKSIDTAFSSQKIDEVVTNDKKFISTTKDIPLSYIHNVLYGQGTSLVLPAFHFVTKEKEPTAELNGTAIFKKDKLVGYLSPEQTRTFLYCIDEISGGLITIKIGDKKRNDTTLEISKSETKRSFSYDQDHLKMNIDVKATVRIEENQTHSNVLNKDVIDIIKKEAEQTITNQIQSLLQEVIAKYQTDIFGFGTMVYQKNPKLWSQLQQNGEEYLQTMEFQVKAQVKVENTATVK